MIRQGYESDVGATEQALAAEPKQAQHAPTAASGDTCLGIGGAQPMERAAVIVGLCMGAAGTAGRLWVTQPTAVICKSTHASKARE